MTGQCAAIAAAKSPPETLPKAKGKLFGPITTTGPIPDRALRIFAFVSRIGVRQFSVRAACAARRSWFVVGGGSTSGGPGDFG